MKKMKRFLALALATVTVAGCLAGCGSSDTKQTETTKNDKTEAKYDLSKVKLLHDGELSVGAEVGYPPFESFADDGTTAIGFDVDIVSEIADRLGLKVNVVNTGFDGIFAGIGVNYDIVCSAVTITPEREATMLFSTPYISNYQTVVVAKDSDLQINSLNDLDGLSAGVQKETTSDILLSDYKDTGSIDVTIVANKQVISSFTQLENGEIDVVVCDSSVADGYVAKNPDKYKIAYKDDKEPEDFGIALAQDNVELQKIINEILADLEEEGWLQDESDYWFGA